MKPAVVRTLDALRSTVAGWRGNQESVGVVPTMGALHEGHLSLVKAAREQVDRVIVTLFVNPTQFDNAEDLTAYPRDAESDRTMLEAVGVDLLYMPTADEVYGEGFSTTVSVGGLSEGMCGAYRPGHFDGVATVVTKLFLQTAADFGLFGEKDFQQLQIVKQLALDLDIPIKVIGCPTIRDADGLALSSRNQRLSPKDRKTAAALYAILTDTTARLATAQTAPVLLKEASTAILEAGFDRVEYLELRAEERLVPLQKADQPARLMVAAWLGGVRLIDNIAIPTPKQK